MLETPDDLRRLQALLDRSYQAAGTHLREVITPERRLTSVQLCDRLDGMRLLVLATVTADARPLGGPVDGFFYRAAWYFGSSDTSLRFRHIRQRPQVSATHVPDESLSVTTHGRAVEVDVGRHDGGRFRRMLLDHYGARFENAAAIVDGPGTVYARIEADRMFTFHLDPSTL